MSSESYVVRIYRREAQEASRARRCYDRLALDGIVEDAEGGGRWSFHGIEELWEFLARRPGKPNRKSEKGKP